MIIDDHALVREGIKALLEADLPGVKVQMFSSLPSVAEVLTTPPDLIICDYRVGTFHALDFLTELSAHSPSTSVLMISMLDELEVGPPCIRAGAKGFVSKSAPSEEILSATRMLLAGKTYMSSRVTRALMSPASWDHSLGPESPSRRLSQRELHIFSALGEGLAVGSIAQRCGISVKTVETHRENIKNKLNLHSAAEVVIAAAQWLRSGS